MKINCLKCKIPLFLAALVAWGLPGCPEKLPEAGPGTATAFEADFTNVLEELVSPLTLLQVRLVRGEIGKKEMEALDLLPAETTERLSRLVEGRAGLLQVSVEFRRKGMAEKTVYVGYNAKITLDGLGSRVESWGTNDITVIWGRITKPRDLPVPAVVLMSRKILDESTSYTLVFIIVPA